MHINNNYIVEKNIYYAFFDVDETIIQEKSMFSFLSYYSKKMALKFNIFTVIKYLFFISLIKYLKFKKAPRDYINKIYYRFYKGIEINTLNNFGNEWFNEARKKNNFFKPNIINEIRSHKMNGAKVIFVSGSFQACLKPIAEYLDIDEILCTEMEVVNEKYTGKLLNIPAIGKGKLILIKRIFLFVHYYMTLDMDLSATQQKNLPHLVTKNGQKK